MVLPPSGPARVTNASIFIGTLAGIVVVIGLLLSFDLFLARLDRRASNARAADDYAAGLALLRAGHPSDAVDRLSAAVAIDRASVSYALALGEAMLQEGRVLDAEATLRALLDRAENDGAVNLTTAHVMLREGRTQDAKAYFHRAVFGRWGADSVERRTQARFELIDLLARTGASRELLAELLPLEEIPADSVDLRRRLGHLFIIAGSPTRAANMFREVLQRDQNDVDAYIGLGEAALALGNFRTARADFAEALRVRPSDARIAERLALADTVLALDPTARGVGALDRLARSRELLRRILDTGVACRLGRTAAADSAQRLLASPPKQRDPDAAAETMMNVAVEIWTERPVRCASNSANDALRLVLNRLAQ